MHKPPSLRERKKAQTRVLQLSHEMFARQGYEATTVEEVCEGAMISKRTFFRYFPDKESLVFPNRRVRLERFLSFLEDSPAGEVPFVTLKRATQQYGEDYMEHREALMTRQALVASSPELVSRELEIDGDWESAIASIFLAWAPDDEVARRRMHLLAGAMIGVIRATMRYWFATGGKHDLIELGLDAIACLEDGFPLVRKR